MKAFWKYLCFVACIALCLTAVAYGGGSYGDMARGAMGPIDAITKLLRVVCVLTGVGLFFSGCVKFFDWRRNPIETTLGLVLALLFAGLALMGLALLPEMYSWLS